MRRTAHLVLTAALALWLLPLCAATYYVDSAGGSDANNGTSTNTAWQSLAKVNGTTFSPGDAILFKAGGIWAGTTQLNPKGSGATNNPIVIDMYGSGSKPIIDAGSATGNGAVYLSNQQYWEINNLEITGDASGDGDRRGVYFKGTSGTLNHLHLRNCYIHNIRGTFSSSDGSSTSPGKRTGGLVVEDTGSTSFNDILIENNEIQTVRNEGLVACLNATSARNVIIRGNTIHDVTKNGMVIRICDSTCLIEHNLCYNTATMTTGNTMFTAAVNGPVFQFNEGYGNLAGDHDGSMYDADLNSKNVVFQYSYSHDNSHGLYWQYSASSADTGMIVRYNISQNDHGNIFSLSGSGGSDYFYNNTIYIPVTNIPPTNLPRYIIDDRSSGHTEYFYNNIFYNLSSAAQYHLTSGNTHTFDYNVFYGQHPASEPADAHKLTSEPMLVAPGTGATGATNSLSSANDMNSLGGYLLQAGSPCIDSGMTVANNGGRDYFGNTVPFNGATDRGAHEFLSAVSTPPDISQQPQDLTVTNGNSAGFNVTATGTAPLAYQWRKGGVPIGGATATNLFFGAASTNDAASYTVVITNGAGSITSTVATLTVLLPPPITPPQLSSVVMLTSGGFQFSFTNAAAANFTVLCTTNVALPLSNWTSLGPATETAPGQYQFTDPASASNAARYYRVRSP